MEGDERSRKKVFFFLLLLSGRWQQRLDLTRCSRSDGENGRKRGREGGEGGLVFWKREGAAPTFKLIFFSFSYLILDWRNNFFFGTVDLQLQSKSLVYFGNDCQSKILTVVHTHIGVPL